MSIELCVVCDNQFDPKADDIAIFEPASICGNCVQLVRDAYDIETDNYVKVRTAEVMRRFDDLIAKFPTKVT